MAKKWAAEKWEPKINIFFASHFFAIVFLTLASGSVLY